MAICKRYNKKGTYSVGDANSLSKLEKALEDIKLKHAKDYDKIHKTTCQECCFMVLFIRFKDDRGFLTTIAPREICHHPKLSLEVMEKTWEDYSPIYLNAKFTKFLRENQPEHLELTDDKITELFTRTRDLEERHNLFRSIEHDVASIISFENKGKTEFFEIEIVLPGSFYITTRRQNNKYYFQSAYYVKDIGSGSIIKRYTYKDILKSAHRDVFSDLERKIIMEIHTDGVLVTPPAFETNDLPQGEICDTSQIMRAELDEMFNLHINFNPLGTPFDPFDPQISSDI